MIKDVYFLRLNCLVM